MGQYDEKSIELFQQMQQEGLLIPDMLNALAGLRALEEGRHVHMQIMQSGCQLDAYVGSSLTEFVATFVSLLSACSHAGLLDEGLVYFDYMCSVYGISATVKHYMSIWLISWPGWPSAGGRGFDQYDAL
jgi:pentatricopeptide repeat protein